MSASVEAGALLFCGAAMTAAKRSGNLWLLGLLAALALGFIGRQIIVGDVAALIAQLWVSVMGAVLRLWGSLFGF